MKSIPCALLLLLIACPRMFAAAPSMNTAFAYQGQLKHLGVPVSGQGDFRFRLYDALTNGNQVGTQITKASVDINDGLFKVELDFGVAAFEGSDRWLEVEVEFPSGAGNATILTPRQRCSPTPYALQTRGIYVNDAGNVGVGTLNPQAPLHVTGDSSRTLRVRNSSPTGGTAIVAETTTGSGYAAALDAYVASPDGTGVYSFNEAESGNAYAVHAESNSPAGIAIFGEATVDDERSSGVGVYGRSRGDDGAAGVYGEATNTGTTYGVRGVSMHDTGVRGDNSTSGNYGELGTSTAGVFGRTDHDSQYAVAGHAGSGNAFAGYFTGGKNYFEGRLGIGTLTPAAELHVAGDIRLDAGGSLSFGNNLTQMYETADELYLQANGGIHLDGSSLFVNSANNHVGIGTNVPAVPLDVVGDIRTSGDFAYDSHRTFYLNVPACAFQLGYPDPDDHWITNSAYGYIGGCVPPCDVRVDADIHLPEDAQVEGVTLFFYDNDATLDLDVSLTLSKRTITTTAAYTMVQLDFAAGGQSSLIREMSSDLVSAATIDNYLHQLVLSLNWETDGPSTSLRFYGVRVEYTITRVKP